jgi:Ca2+-transporting ATPase
MDSSTFSGQAPESIAWHTLEHLEVCQVLQVSPDIGLTEAEVVQRRAEFGPNEIVPAPRSGFLWQLPSLVFSPLILLVFACSLASFFTSRLAEGIALLFIAVLDGLPGLILEIRSSQVLRGYQLPLPHFAHVRRGGRECTVDPRDLVPGDVIHLFAGDIVPADARLIGSVSLLAQEGPLTGENHTSDKVPQALRSGDIPLHERHNLVFCGTNIVHGQGEAVVIQTGRRTELGRISANPHPAGFYQTPLGGSLDRLSNLIAAGLLGAFAVTLAIGSLHTEIPAVILQTWAGIAVSLIPEALPLVTALLIVRGRRALLRRNALVREAAAMGTLGAVTVICTDQSGPLTEDVLRVEYLDAGGTSMQFDEPLRKGRPILVEEPDATVLPWPPHSLLLALGVLSSPHAAIQRDDDGDGEYTASGDPVEAAVLVAAARVGLWKARLDRLYPRILEAPYSAERGRRSALHHVRVTPHVSTVELPLASLLIQRSPFFVVATGKPTELLDVCDRVRIDGHILPFTQDRREEASIAADRLEAAGKYVSGIAYRPLDRLPALVEDYPIFDQEFPIDLLDLPLSPKDTPSDVQASYELEHNLIFVGWQGIQEEIRPDALEAILACRKVGIRPVLMTTHNPEHAAQIARRIGIPAGHQVDVLNGREIEHLSRSDLEHAVESVSVFSQISPHQRLKIVQALQRQGEVVAITGEEASDGPALSGSDVGAAIATRERQGALPDANLVLLDGSFATLLRAVEEGRWIYQHVRRFLRFSLSRSVALFIILILGPWIGMHTSLNPIQALCLNLACDGLLGMPLVWSLDRRGSLRGRDLAPGGTLLARGLGRSIFWSGVGIALIAAGAGWFANRSSEPVESASVFCAIVFAQMWLVGILFFRANHTRYKVAPRRMALLIGSIGVLYAILVASISWSPLLAALGLKHLSVIQFFSSFAFGALILPWQLLPGLFYKK